MSPLPLNESNKVFIREAYLILWPDCCDGKIGLLASLDYHQELQAKKTGEGTEIEFRLYSWGKIYLSFLGDREHSTAAELCLDVRGPKWGQPM